MITLTALLFPVWTPELGAAGMPYTDKYNVTLAGEVIVERSRDPETDLARALKARGHTGTVTLLDGATGRPRTVINIEMAAKCGRWRPVAIPASGPLRHVQRARRRLKRGRRGMEEAEGIEKPPSTRFWCLSVTRAGNGDG